MSVLVKNMEMPKECRECPLWEYRHGIGTTWCVPTKTLLAENYMPIAFDGRHSDCPLVEVEDDDRGHAVSTINREDALEAILSRLAEREEPCPPWIYATIRECLDDLPSLPSTEPLVHDGYYLCDKKPGACPSWERKGWTKCESKHCNRTSRVDHALKLPDDGWIPVSEHLPEKNGFYLVTLNNSYTDFSLWEDKKGFGMLGTRWYPCEEVTAWMPFPKPYEPKEDK